MAGVEKCRDRGCQTADDDDRKTSVHCASDVGGRRCDQPHDRSDDVDDDNVDDDDGLGGLRRRDDESVEAYLVRSIVLLGSLANPTNSSTAVQATQQASDHRLLTGKYEMF